MVERIDKAAVTGKKVLVRVDFNVPLDKIGNITDDKRITDALPTLQYLLKNNAAVILMSHLGRPAKASPEEKEKLKMDKIAVKVSELLGKEVKKLDDCVGEAVESACGTLMPGEVILLENLRFHPEEKENDSVFARRLASLADIYCNDAFAVCHRAHASVSAITTFLPGYAGMLLDTELTVIGKAMDKPERPFVAIVGGAKLRTKIPLIKNLLGTVDKIIIGGAMMFTFYKAKGLEIGKSLLDKEGIAIVKKLLDEHADKLLLPTDVVCARALVEGVDSAVYPAERMPADQMGLDIGPASIRDFSAVLKDARTIIWNGPMGAFESKPFDTGTKAIGAFLADQDSVRIIGGGDTALAVEQAGVADKMTHISTGGGASLALFSGERLVAVEALEQHAPGGC